MPSFYPYLIASLPMLHFDMKPPFSFERFLELARDCIPHKDAVMLAHVPLVQEYGQEGEFPLIVKRWVAFDTGLRNALVKLRAARTRTQAGQYVRPGGAHEAWLDQLALAVARSASPYEAERMLDEARWKALDELAQGYYFDIESLVVYAYKLKILARWDAVRAADKEQLLASNIKQ